MNILGIESSCDETACAVVRDGREVLSNVVYTQIPLHQPYGGVVPEVASRAHIEKIHGVVAEAMRGVDALDAVAVTYGPGLASSLLVGLNAAKGLALALGVPLIGINHIEAHLHTPFLFDAPGDGTPPPAPEDALPALGLAVSGGHTTWVDMPDYGAYTIIGQTLDDAAGEAFDKIARVLGLPYPGGPRIDKLAHEGQPTIDFPRALQEKGNYEFSFSGLKSAVLNYINSERMKGHELNLPDIAASFQSSVVEVLAHKAFEALEASGLDTLVLAGGVAANSALEARLREGAAKRGVKFYFPDRILCTDNAAMIACRGYYQAQAGAYSDLYLNAVPGLSLQDVGED